MKSSMNSVATSSVSDGRDMKSIEISESGDGAKLEKPTHRLPRAGMERHYHIDWRRFCAVILMIAVHITVSMERVVYMATEHPYHKSIKSFQLNLLMFGLGVFFDAAGRAQARKHDSLWIFVRKRAMRLLLPCVIGMFSILPINEFLGRRYRPGQPVGADKMTFWQYVPRFFHTISSLDYLWFLPTLFCISIYNYFIGRWMYNIRTLETKTLRSSDVFTGGILGFLHIFVIPFIAYRMLHWCVWFSVGFGLMYFWSISLVLSYGYVSKRHQNVIEVYVINMMITCLTVLASCVGVSSDILQKNLKMPQPGAEFILATVFYNLYYLHGMLAENFVTITIPKPCTAADIPILFLFIPSIGFTFAGQPTSSPDLSYIWAFPAYKRPYLAVLYCWASFCFMVHIDYISRCVIGGPFHPIFARHASQIGYLAYLLHGIPIELVASQYLYPRRREVHLITGVILELAAIISFCITTYVTLLWIKKLVAKLGHSRSL